jgi:hypothetical protein
MMGSSLPADALGSDAENIRKLLIKVIRVRHDLAAEAHASARTRYSMVFGSQWRDLLDDVREAVGQQGFAESKLLPAGYYLPIVNDCLLYVWRVPGTADPVGGFASSPTRRSMFSMAPPDQMMLDLGFGGQTQPDPYHPDPNEAHVTGVVKDVGAKMPVVLVKVHSSPDQLRSIEWAIAEYDEHDDQMNLMGLEVIWQADAHSGGSATGVESFDSGTPVAADIDVQEQENKQRNA